ncbi:MAG: hypothetical protein OEW89_04100 [Gammaproteobacteria bacterium]|nr:hypothetical protein [Gammaproteobacteria bacterium]MDH5593198.1 hypothetical protein [Gammaproteobacteria bacterium]
MFKKEVAAQFGSKAQELLMQDILEGMEDFVSKFGYRAQKCEFEIIPLKCTARTSKNKSMDTAENKKQDAEIISFEEVRKERTLRRSA